MASAPGFDCGKCPIKPRGQGFDVVGFNGGAAPDTKARWRVTIPPNVKGDLFCIQKVNHAFDERFLFCVIECRDVGIRDLQTNGRI